MPFTLEVLATEGIVRATATGHIELEDIRQHMASVRQAGASRFPELIDVTRAESAGFSLREMLTLAMLARELFGSSFMAPRAVLVRSKRHFEWARIFGSLVAGWMTVGVFTDRHEAMLWLEHKTSRERDLASRRAAVS